MNTPDFPTPVETASPEVVSAPCDTGAFLPCPGRENESLSLTLSPPWQGEGIKNPLEGNAGMPLSEPAPGRVLLTTVTLEAPLIGVESARLALRCGEDDILEWILSGDLEWAFDVRRVGARRACWRILTESVVCKQQRGGRITPREREAQKSHPFEEIFDGLFRHRRPVLSSTELARVWNCGASHIHNLIEDGALAVVEKHYAPREVFQFPRQKIFAFMQSRRTK